MKKINNHINKIISNIHCNSEDKNELRAQMEDHLISLKDEFIEKGHSDNEAEILAIKTFGDGKDIIQNLNCTPIVKNSLIRNLLYGVFALYIVFLIVLLLNPARASFTISNRYIKGGFNLTYNLIPFKNIIYYITNINNNNLSIFFYNIFGNALLFIPLGFLVPLVFKNCISFTKTLKISAIFVVGIEIIRAIFPFGVCDVDHIILRILGIIVGYSIFKILFDFMSRKK